MPRGAIGTKYGVAWRQLSLLTSKVGLSPMSLNGGAVVRCSQPESRGVSRLVSDT